MSITASWWCPTQEVAKTPSIPIIKQQAWGCFSKISCTDGPNDLYKNWGLSFVLFFKFFSCWSGVVVVFKNSILKITSSICRFFNHVPTQKKNTSRLLASNGEAQILGLILDFPQVAALRRLCALSNDPATLRCDSWGVKKLFSYGCRRAGFHKALSKSPTRRAPQLYH